MCRVVSFVLFSDLSTASRANVRNILKKEYLMYGEKFE